MKKTIEEVAIEFAEQNHFREDDRYSFRENTDRSIEASAYAFEEGAGYIFSLPLRDRLTEAEKERVRNMYKEAVEGKCELEKMQPQNTYAKNSIAMKIGVNMGCILALESIFGADFFKEEG